MTDLKFAFRQLLKNPGYSAIAIAVLAVGLAANTAVFGLVDAAFYRPLSGVWKPDQLVGIEAFPRGGQFSLNNLNLLRGSPGAFQDFAAYDRRPALFFSGDAQTRVQAEFVSRNYFSMLGVKPYLGRLLDETDRGTPHVVISHRLWRARFGANEEIVGKQLVVNDRPFTIVGVAPEGFGGMQSLMPVGAWLSCELTKPHLPDRTRGDTGRWLTLFGRMKPGVSVAAARDSLLPLQSQICEPQMLRNHGSLELSPCGRGALSGIHGRGTGRQISLFLFIVVALVLAVACANLACLLLSRVLNRRREIAIRTALGSSRGQLIRQLLTEPILLSFFGGLLGLILATWGVRLITLALPRIAGTEDVVFSLNYNWRIIIYTIVASLVVAVLCGILPALRATQVECQAALKNETAGIGPVRGWLGQQTRLIIEQVGVCVVLLVGGGLMLRSLVKSQDQTLAFDYDHCFVTALWDRDPAIPAAEHQRVRRELLETARSLPGVTAVALSHHPPLSADAMGTMISDPQNGNSSPALTDTVTPGFFATLEIPVILGRDFSINDVNHHSNDVAIISESLAADLWPEQNPLGRYVQNDERDYQVIGVVRDACYEPGPGTTGKPVAGIYFCDGEQAGTTGGYLMIRTSGNTKALRGLVASLVRQADPGHEQPYVVDYADLVARVFVLQRTAAWVLGLASAIALVLVGAGLYGALSYHIAQRTREIGVRLALGADRRRVLRDMLRRGLTPVAIGFAIGGGVGVLGSGLLRTLLIKTSPADPMTLGTVCILIMAIAILACWLPAHRAANLDPMEALRNE